MIQASRKNDAVISVIQKNQGKTIEILDINRAAESLLGYEKTELMGKPLQKILTQHIQDQISDYLDFEVRGNDLSSVLMRCRRCAIVNQGGYEIPVRVKVFYGVPTDRNYRFEIVLQDITLFEKIETFKEQLIAQNVTYQTTTATGIPNEREFWSTVQFVSDFVTQSNVDVVFGLIAIDHLEVYGTVSMEELHKLIKRIILHIRQKCREEDMVGYVSETRFGLILFDCNAANAKRAFERIHEHLHFDTGILHHGDSQILNTSISFLQMPRGISAQQVLGSCDKTLNVIQFQGGNQIREVTAPHQLSLADIMARE